MATVSSSKIDEPVVKESASMVVRTEVNRG